MNNKLRSLARSAMADISIRSVRSLLRFFAGIILALSAFSIVSIFANRIVAEADQRYHQILQVEKEFSSLIVEEKNCIKNLCAFESLGKRYDNLQQSVDMPGFERERQMILYRMELFEQLHDVQKDIARQHTRVRQLLPDLITSVRYIHEHHIGYFKNLLRRGHTTQDWDTGADFKRSPVRAASELDIIRSAVTIQNNLLDIFAIFYKLLIGETPSSLTAQFQRDILVFYGSINIFEDYSLDAQDGLLVEELLITGRSFESSFTSLLDGEASIKRLSDALAANSDALFRHLEQANDEIDRNNSLLSKRLKYIHYLSFAIFMFLIVFLLVYSRKMIHAFRRTTRETQRIQNDLAHKIEIEKSDYMEFIIIFEALNAMAETIEGQIAALNQAGSELSRRVRERTGELEEANRKLKKEIDDRITAEKKRIELESKLTRAQKMEAIGMLAGGVAHDLNNILSGLTSYPELLLLDIPENSSLRNPILTIKRSGEKAATIVQDLLTLARRGVAVTEILNLNEIIQAYLSSPEFELLKHHHDEVAMVRQLDKRLLLIDGSPVHLLKTIMNLVANAYESMPDGGGVKIATTIAYVDTPVSGYGDVRPGEYAVLTISDNGVGISEEDIERIFEPFYTRKVMGRSGSGLGMAVVWGTVKDHNGYIDVQSRVGQGTDMTIYLPLVPDAVTPEKDNGVGLDAITGNLEKILIVDDVAEQREIASGILKKLGYQVRTADSGETAVEYMTTHDADLLVLDMVMAPGMDGLDTYKRILDDHPGQRAIITSGFSETSRVKAAKKLGVGGYVKKPYTIENLGTAVRNALAGRPAPAG